MMLQDQFDFIENPLSAERFQQAVNVLLSLQNTDGGWPSYELKRAGSWLEMLNPSDCFDGIMVDYSYCECTSACMKALHYFRNKYPTHRRAEIDTAIKRGALFLKKIQRSDGSWHGAWGVCYSYAIWFAVGAFCENGERDSSAVQKACTFLIAKQREDGSWGEDFKSCCERRWVEYREGHAVSTAWAVLALMQASYAKHKENVKRGIKWLIKSQLPCGDWQQQGIIGVFNYNCAISYSGYKNIFPIWALGKYCNGYQHAEDFDVLELHK